MWFPKLNSIPFPAILSREQSVIFVLLLPEFSKDHNTTWHNEKYLRTNRTSEAENLESENLDLLYSRFSVRKAHGRDFCPIPDLFEIYLHTETLLVHHNYCCRKCSPRGCIASPDNKWAQLQLSEQHNPCSVYVLLHCFSLGVKSAQCRFFWNV